MKIVDCFIFYNEIEMLTYRLNLLKNHVDYFVLIESRQTFIGKEKKLFFNENKHLFEQFNIIHVIVDLPYPYPTTNVWENEYHQRNSISIGIDHLRLLNEDVIILSDVDEIPNPHVLDHIKKGNIIVTANTLVMDFYYYNLNTKLSEMWTLCKIISYEKYKEYNSCNDIRRSNCSAILNGGWHLSYFGDNVFIQNKIQNFSHQELNTEEFTNLEKIKERINNVTDLYDRNIPFQKIKIEENTNLPPQYDTYLKNFYLTIV
jgi:beta-1,4-mannosyl-glycoprotein beta-1,4-N-acetylglucosaminyltransferase